MRYLILIFILLNLSIVLGANSLSLVLDKEKYSPDSFLHGNIFLNLDRELDLGLEPDLIIYLDNIKEKRNIIDILNSLDNNLEIISNSKDAADPAIQKDFSLAQNKLFGFKIPKGSEITKIDFDITGLNANGFPNLPFIDFEEYNIWFYAGIFNGWNSQSQNAIGLSDIKAGDITIDSNDVLNCEIVSLPYANTFNVSIEVNTLDNSGNISLHMFRFDADTNTAEEKIGECELKNIPGLDSPSCIINSAEYIIGNHLVCFYNDKNSGIYSLPVDDNGDSRYECDSSALDTATECSVVDDGDFFIKSFNPVYIGELDKSVKFSDFSFEDEVKIALNDYLNNCEENDENDCVLYFNSGAQNNKGSLRLSNLFLEYVKPNQIKSVLRNFYDVEETTAKILGLKTGDFINYSLKIPLSVFDNLTVPGISDNTSTMNMKVGLNALSDEKTIFVDKNLFLSPKEIIDDALFSLNMLKNNSKYGDIFSVLNINMDDLETSLNNYNLQLDQLAENNITIDQKNEQSDLIKEQINIILETVPKVINIKTDVEYPRIFPIKIDAQLLNGETEENILNLQDSVKIETKVKLFSITDFSGETTQKTLIKRSLSSDLDEYSVVEDISKEIASSVSSIKFNTDDYIVIKDDPLIKWNIKGNQEIAYLIEGDILNKLNKITTTVLTKSDTEEYAGEPECGDNICTEILEDEITCPSDCKPKYKINWPITIILLIILILGVIYFNFFMGKRSLKELIVKKPVFASLNDETNLRNYILRSLNNKVPRTLIYKALLSKKWTKAQIDYVFNKLDRPITNNKENILNKIINKFKKK